MSAHHHVTAVKRARARVERPFSRRVTAKLAVLRSRAEYLKRRLAKGDRNAEVLMELTATDWAVRVAEDHFCYCATVANDLSDEED